MWLTSELNQPKPPSNSITTVIAWQRKHIWPMTNSFFGLEGSMTSCHTANTCPPLHLDLCIQLQSFTACKSSMRTTVNFDPCYRAGIETLSGVAHTLSFVILCRVCVHHSKAKRSDETVKSINESFDQPKMNMVLIGVIVFVIC